MGLPPTISLLTETPPILRSGRISTDEFIAAGSVLADAATIDAVRDLHKNRLRVSLFDIPVFPAIYLHNQKHPGRSTRRIAYRMSEENVLVFPQLKLFGRVIFLAIVKMSGQALRSGEKIHVRGDKTRGDVII